MKKNLKTKYLSIFLGLLFLFNTIPTEVLAQEANFLDTAPITSTTTVTKIGSTTIVNRSDKKFFVPNKTTPEIQSFADNAPKYVSVSVCGDKVCSEGETFGNCKVDCPLPVADCGDGICAQSNFTYVYNPPIWVDVPAEYCDDEQWGVIAGATAIAAAGTAMACVIGGPIGCALASAIFGPSLTYLFTQPQCYTVNQPQEIKEVVVPIGEVYATTTNLVAQVECPADCSPPNTGSNCGVCGFGTDGSLCPNFCAGGAFNRVNCEYRQPTYYYGTTEEDPFAVFNNHNSLKKYLTAAEALAVEITPATYYDVESYDFRDEGGYVCEYDGDTSALCPAGKYCSKSAGLKPGTDKTANMLGVNNIYNEENATTCPAGYFCPIGSYYPRPCPSSYYSVGNAGLCTKCPAGTRTLSSGASALSSCVASFTSNDGVCNLNNGTANRENPVNSPRDCPDLSNIALGIFVGDGRCSGYETRENSPIDCSCGDGVCNNSETYLSCLSDCACMDNICGTSIWANGTTTIFKEKNKCNGTQIVNSSTCSFMGDNEECGDGVCDYGEWHRAGAAVINCALDCHCGDGLCNRGEFYSSTNAVGSCNADCTCGDGICNNNETAYYCKEDCHCGDGKCEIAYDENFSSCSEDCVCGDNICSENEYCADDCGTNCNNNSVCEPLDGEYRESCLDCKFFTNFILQ